MGHLMSLIEGDRALLNAIHGKSISELMEDSFALKDVVEISRSRPTNFKNVNSRFHRHGDRRIDVEKSEVRWTPAYQNYFSAGDESEPYCSNCEEALSGGMKFCPSCGQKLISIFETYNGFIEEEGVPY